MNHLVTVGSIAWNALAAHGGPRGWQGCVEAAWVAIKCKLAARRRYWAAVLMAALMLSGCGGGGGGGATAAQKEAMRASPMTTVGWNIVT
jgi:hypothetical protein